MSFEQIGLSEELLRAIRDSGYDKPTPIQEQAIPYVLMNRDVLGCAQTGTGKTASFTLPMLDILANGRARARMPRSLILEPTRELAAQVAENFDKYGKYQKLNKALLIGGVSFDDQERLLDRGVDVLIATPGRLLDHFERGKVLLSDVKILVIDEADRMLDMGFIPDVERICSLIPRIRQTLMFSATMPPEIRRLAEKFLMNPKEVTVAPPATAAATVEQRLVTVNPDDKRSALRMLLNAEDVKNALVFCNRKRDVDVVQRSLKSHGFDVAALHGDMDQFRRTDTLDRFKNGEVRLLVCSDVAARGLDIAAVSHVFNFDVPIHADDYIHRIGRTGRAGRSGKAFTIAAPEDGKFIAAIQKLTGQPIEPVSLDGFDAAALEEGDGRRRGRGKKRSDEPARPSKSSEKKRPEPRAKRREETAEKPAAATEPRPERSRKPEPVRAHASKPAPAAPKPAAAPARAKSKSQDEAKRPFRDSGEVPAFLLRRAPIDSAA